MIAISVNELSMVNETITKQMKLLMDKVKKLERQISDPVKFNKDSWNCISHKKLSQKFQWRQWRTSMYEELLKRQTPEKKFLSLQSNRLLASNNSNTYDYKYLYIVSNVISWYRCSLVT